MGLDSATPTYPRRVLLQNSGIWEIQSGLNSTVLFKMVSIWCNLVEVGPYLLSGVTGSSALPMNSIG